jgi:hypothetical protein
MDYQKVYNSIVERGQVREPEGYYEVHHILPRCMGGGNEKENLTKLTAREHFIAHWLLVRIYPNNGKLANAFWMMSNCLIEGREYSISGRAYEEARILYSKSLSEKWNDPKYREKMETSKKEKGSNKKTSETAKKNWLNPEFKDKYSKKISKSSKDRWSIPEYKENISTKNSEASKNLWKNSEHKEKMSKINSESARKAWENPEYRKKMSENSRKRWQDPSYREKFQNTIRKNSEAKKSGNI